ncbi:MULTISPECIES: hypothetical protein [Nocardia]|uniref:hypothetical protein n=1 Tax=Nocardia TaxID=1817 RepID=UPI001300613A|nr:MULTISPECIES: hypothetical protein [Nocardia]
MATEEDRSHPSGAEPPNALSDAVQQQIRVASRNGRYALAVAVLAAVAALLSSGVSAWTSVHVSSTEIDRQERLARHQALRADRLRAYADFVTAYLGIELQLGDLKGILIRPANNDLLQTAMTELHDSLAPYLRSSAMLHIVMSSSANAELGGINAAQDALLNGPDSLAPTLEYARDHQIATDENWPRLAAAGVAAIDRFVSDTAIDEFVTAARKDVAAG